MAAALKIVFIAIALVIIYKLVFGRRQARTLFEMKFKDGRLVSHFGKIPEKFAKESRTIAKNGKLTCIIRAEQADKVKLHISANAGDNYVQQLQSLFPHQYYLQEK